MTKFDFPRWPKKSRFFLSLPEVTRPQGQAKPPGSRSIQGLQERVQTKTLYQAIRQRSAGEDTSSRKHGGQDSNNEDGKLIAMLKTEIDEKERELAVKRKENAG